MSEFKELRNKINLSLAQRDKMEKEVYLKQELLKQIQENKRQLARGANPRNPKDVLAEAKLTEKENTLKKVINEGKANLKKNFENLHVILEQFQKFSDPREAISELNDRNPIMLLPLRIETRFKVLKDKAGKEKHQLWVRVYPDEIAIDSFEETLSESEVEIAKDYWQGVWQAGDREIMERATWRNLVSSVGTGRARYILETFFPINQNSPERPKNANEKQLFLTIGVEEMPNDTEKLALQEFWKNLWLAGSNNNKQQEAKQILWDKLSGSSEEKEVRFIEILNTLKPSNFNDSSRYSEEGLEVSVLFLHFPKREDLFLKSESWSQAPKTQVMPDRFVITAYNGKTQSEDTVTFQEIGNLIPADLKMGPDPTLSEAEQMKPLNDDIKINDDLKWMFDFDEAVSKGMGFKIDLTPVQARKGFDRIVVVGVKISSDVHQSVESIEKLFHNHERSRNGLTLLPQGTPTNNTEESNSDFSYLDDSDQSFDQLKQEQEFTTELNWIAKKDGQWLAELLGVDRNTFKNTPNAFQTDQTEARAMNLALFPATIGYTMESMMKEVFSEEDVENTRFFFHNYVSARGMIPAIKIGKQPYGILPTTKFDSMKWTNLRGIRSESLQNPWMDGMRNFLPRFYEILKKIDQDWENQLKEVAFLGKESSDAHQQFLDIVGLTPNSIEFYQRIAESEEALINRLRAEGKDVALEIKDLFREESMKLLSEFGYKGRIPEILRKFFFDSQNKLSKVLIDDVPISEVNSIRNYTTSGENYIEWLQKAARESHNTLRTQQGFTDNKVPNTLFYLMLKHALDLGYINTCLDMNFPKEQRTLSTYINLKSDPVFLHVNPNVKETESRWKYLYENNLEIMGDVNLNWGSYIPRLFNTELASSYLKQQLDALDYLKNASTAKLERAFVEHIDLCTYRLDAWKNALLNFQLSTMRYDSYREEFYPNENDNAHGTYLGAYGWLEDVRSENKVLTPVNLTDSKLKEAFSKETEPPLMTDSENGGFIGAPSLNQAVTASILRNAYMSDENAEVFEINLSSERVRKALALIEGIREGQSLSALLGYYFERELHDQNHSLTHVNYYIHLMRKAFPLNLNKIKSTQTEESESLESVKANNVLDGLALINHIRKTGKNQFPFGKSQLSDSKIDPPSDAIKNAINEQVNNITNLNDSIADIAIAESVHQLVLGNFDRAAATLDTYSKGNFPPIPEVIQTPRKGINITQRFGLQFNTGINPAVFTNPRSKAEPAISDWLTNFVLPDLDKIAVIAVLKQKDGSEIRKEITADKLNLEAIDLLFMLNTETTKSMTVLDDLIENYLLTTQVVRPDSEIVIKYTERIVGKTNFFQLAAQLESLRRLLLQSRPLEPMDVALPIEADSTQNEDLFLDESRVNTAIASLQAFLVEIDAFLNKIPTLVPDEEINTAENIKVFDPLTSELAILLSKAALYGLPQTGTGFIYEKKRAIYKAMISKLEELIQRWEERVDAFNTAIEFYDDFPAATADEDRFLQLHKAESYISTQVEIPQPNTPTDLRNNLDAKANAFIAKLNDFKAILSSNPSKVKDLLDKIPLESTTSPFDPTPMDVSEQENAMAQFVNELKSHAEDLKEDIVSRISKAETNITEAHDLVDGKEKVELIQNAGKFLFGEDFKMIPEFKLSTEQAKEWSNSYNDTDLLKHLEDSERDFPLDEWVYSLARVREKIRDWEKVVSLKEAFKGSSLELKPVQLPYKPGESWLASDFPEDYVIDNDKVLYTAHYANGFDKNEPQCGLLLDEFTEIIPSKKEDIGVAFHYDRPNSEPPQVILMAMPSQFKGGWEWNELMDAVNDTLNQAKKRAIEPQQIDQTVYTRFLPATMTSSTKYAITASLNYSLVNLINLNLKP